MSKPRAVFSFPPSLSRVCEKACVGLLFTLAGALANASQSIEEVVVTAEFRPVTVAEVPGSVSILSPRCKRRPDQSLG